MSLTENDPLNIFLSLEWFWVWGIAMLISLPTFWLIDLVSARFDKRIHPWLGTWIRWPSNWIGDLFCLTGAVVFATWLYHNARVAENSWITSEWVWIGSAVAGFLTPVVFITVEERWWKSYQGSDKWSVSRIYHSAYMAFMAYILFAAVVRAVYTVVTQSGGEWQVLFGWGLFLGLDRN